MVVGASVVVVVAMVVVLAETAGCVDGGPVSGVMVASAEASVWRSRAISVPLSTDALHALPANARHANAIESRCVRMGFYGNDPQPFCSVIRGGARESFAVTANGDVAGVR